MRMTNVHIRIAQRIYTICNKNKQLWRDKYLNKKRGCVCVCVCVSVSNKTTQDFLPSLPLRLYNQSPFQTVREFRSLSFEMRTPPLAQAMWRRGAPIKSEL